MTATTAANLQPPMLPQDPFKVQVDELPATTSMLTVVGGGIVFEQK
jgi:hypothetical protein